MAQKIVFLMQDKTTGLPFYISLKLNGTRSVASLIKSVKKANRGSRMLQYRVDK